MSESSTEQVTPRIVGRYALFDEIASGGMATVHLGRLVGQVGFSRTVAVKRLHPQYAKDAEFVAMFVDEARLASRIQHPNVVSTLDVVKTDEELFLVMEYVQGEAVSKLVRNAAKKGERIPHNVVLSIMSGMLHGLQAAHDAMSEQREPLNIVHRDISPQNILVGVDGVARVLDFGVAKAAMRSGATRDGQMKGKLSYMSPEQLNGKEVDRRSDVFSTGVVLWEALAGKRLFAGADAGEILGKVLASEVPSPKSLVPSLPDEASDAVMKALARDPEDRFMTARDFAVALEQSAPIATAHAVGEWVKEYGGEEIGKKIALVSAIERHSMDELAELSSGVGRVSQTYREVGALSEPVSSPYVAEQSVVTGQANGSKQRILVTLAVLALGAIAGAVLGSGVLMSKDAAVAPVVQPAFTAVEVVPTSLQARASEEGGGGETPEGSASVAVATTPHRAVHPKRPRVPKTRPRPVKAKSTGTTNSAQPAGTQPEKPSRSVGRPAIRNKCNPPYTVDESGIRKPKPQCLKR